LYGYKTKTEGCDKARVRQCKGAAVQGTTTKGATL
jgi:hypothetical protein